MTERKIMIIEEAVDLFAVNGFSATSVQDITDACGISKGAFYLSFKSKDNLLLEVFQYFCNKLMNRMTEVNKQHIEANESVRLELFFQIYFEEISQYSNFIRMQMREQTKTLNEEIMNILNDFRKKTYEQQTEVLRTVYGDQIEQHLPDLHTLVNGMITGYIEIIIFNKNRLDFPSLARFLVSVTNSIVANLDEPFLKKEQLIEFHLNINGTKPTNEMILKEIEHLLTGERDEHLVVTLEMIEQEFYSEKPRTPVISGMLSNLKDVEETAQLVKLVQSYMEA